MAQSIKADWFMHVLKWDFLILAILLFLWLAKNLGWF